MSRWLRKRHEWLDTLYSLLPTPGISGPVFIIGCGRSGKTTLADLVSNHKKITHLNEPRHLWSSVFPQYDIWRPPETSCRPALAFDAKDFDTVRGKRISRLFRLEAMKTRRPIIIEDSAVNNFRLDWINRIFPDARFIHVYTNGLEVADRISKHADAGLWFGIDDYKWAKIVEYAERNELTQGLAATCNNASEMALLEWRLSTEAAVSFLSGMPSDRYLELNSNKIIANPTEVVATIFEFLQLRPDDVRRHIGDSTSATSRPRRRALSGKECVLGGELLPLSIATEEDLTLSYVESQKDTCRANIKSAR